MAINGSFVALHGNQFEYSISPTQSDVLQIVDLVPGRDGANVYATTQQIHFGDGTTALFDATGNAEAIARLYETAVSRGPDLQGLVAYTNQVDSNIVNLTQVANSMVTSPEFIATYGQLDNPSFINQLYENTVGRAADPGGLAAYVGALDAGQSRGAVALAIGESFEARQDSIGLAGYKNDAATYRLYSALLNRVPDAAGQQVYSAALDAGRTMQDLATAMLNSAEYQAEATGLSDTDFVTRLYNNLLNRDPDAAGLQSFTDVLAHGTSRAAVVAAFVDGSEARAVTAQATHDGWVFTG